ncbi:MAG: hypothetical protein LUC36_04090, partial [Oscillospiraceae bacterium]|nr:hypothetical protein [Oscillospiraceae bacterium]
FVPEPAAHRAIAEGRLFPLHLIEDILLKTSICLFTPTNFPLTRAAQAFVDIIFQVIGQSNK